MIRKLNPNDAESFKKLRLVCLKNNPISWLSSYADESHKPTVFFQNRITSANTPGVGGYYGLFENSKLIGLAQLSTNSLLKKRHIVYIFELMVLPNKRRKGAATKLIKYLLKIVRHDNNVEKVFLYVNSKNYTAISFYNNLGFENITTLEKAVKEMDNTYQDELIFSLDLS